MLFCSGASARLGLAAAIALLLHAMPAGAQTTPPAANDPVVATVNGQPIHLSEVKEAAQSLPPNAQAMPPAQLYPLLIDQIIDGKALVAAAKRDGLDKDPRVQRQMSEAADRALETAALHKAIAPQITDAALRARYDAEIAGKPGEEEVHARHILVPDEATAKQIIAELDKGGDFVALSKQYNKDPGAAQQGGDLGYFKKNEMVPEFAAVAFSLKPGEISQTPVHTQFGWHVIQVLDRRQQPAPSFEQSADELRQKMIQEGVQKAVAQARDQVKVERFNIDGSPQRATDNAEPPPAK